MKNVLLLMAMLVSFIANAYEPMIREDRIWEYLYDGTSSIVYQFKFDGTESKGNKTYHTLKYKVKDSEDEWMPIALMREDIYNKTVYLFVDCKARISLFGEFGDLNITESEIPLYQWSDWRLPNVGGQLMIPMFCSDWPNNFENINNNSVLDMSQRNITYRKKRNFYGIEREIIAYGKLDFINIYDPDFHHIVYVEGIGNVSGGFLHRPIINVYRTGSDFDDMRFLKQTDLNGFITFLPPWQWEREDLDNIESVNAESRPADERKYNLQGVETDRPEPGSIYIQNGEKHIAN